MGFLRPRHRDNDTSRRRRFYKGAAKIVEFLNFKPNGSLKKGKIQNLSDTELIKKQQQTRTSVASSVTGLYAGIVISLACPVVAVGVGISAIQMAVACINRHRVRKEVKKRARSDAYFAKILHKLDPTRKKARDIAVGVSVRGTLSAATMGIVGFDTVAQNSTDLGSAAVGSKADAAAEATGNAAVQTVSHGAYNAASHAATHATGGGIDLPDASNSTASHATIHQYFTENHPHVAEYEAAFHKATAGIADKTAEVISGKTGLDFTGDSRLHQMQHIWHGHDGDVKTKLLFLGQAAVDGGIPEVAQPLQHVSEYGVEKARTWHWKRKANRYEKLEDM